MLAFRCKRKARVDLDFIDLGKVLNDFILGHSIGEPVQDIVN